MRPILLAVGVFVAGVVFSDVPARGQYQAPWPSKKMDEAGLDDVAEDIVSDEDGNTYIAGWVTESAGYTKYQLRILDPSGTTLQTKRWDPGSGLSKAHAIAIDHTFEPGTQNVQSYIYLTGESPNVTNQGLNIVTLRYIWTRGSPGTITGPVVRTWNSNTLSTGNDIGWDIGVVGQILQGTGYICLTGQSQGSYGGSSTGLDSITLGYDEQTWPSSPSWYNRYTQSNALGRDDVTVAICAGPDYGNAASCAVAGYSHGSSTDDFLVRSLNVATGATNSDWRYDTGYDERANAVAAGDPNLGVFATGWTDYTIDQGPLGVSNKNYLTVRYNVGTTSNIWGSIYAGPGSYSGLDDIAYSAVYWPDATDPAIYVGGGAHERKSNGTDTDYDYRIIRYDPDDGSVSTDWISGASDWYMHGVFDLQFGPDECFKIGVDGLGNVYATGRVQRTSSGHTSLDYGTVRFLHNFGGSPQNGILDPDNAIHKFPQFFFDGTSHVDDQANAIDVQGGPGSDEPNPDAFVTGFSVDTNENKNWRTIKYHDPD